MRALIPLSLAAAILCAAIWPHWALAQQRGAESSNRARALGPVRLARASHEEPVDSPAALETGKSASPAPLALKGKSKSSGLAKPTAPSGTRAITTVFGSLGVVLGLFFLAIWFTRRVRPKGLQPLPKEAVEVLGRLPLAGRQQMHLVKVGGKLLLISVSPTGAETLTEITDREEVERLSGLCQMSQPGSITATFRQVLSQFEREPTPTGFVGEAAGVAGEETESPDTPRQRRRMARAR